MNYDNEYSGCLFDVVNDPNEHYDISSIYPNITTKMNARLNELMKTFYNNSDELHPSCNYSVVPENECSCYVIKNYWKGFYGPYCF